MTPDRRSFLTSAGLAALAVGTGLVTTGCSGSASGRTVTPITLDASRIPEGGGLIMADGRYVVTQPTAGEYRAFSKNCTHQGCPVSAIEGAEIVCTCHGARFSIADGSVLKGPATDPLTEATVAVEGDTLTITA